MLELAAAGPSAPHDAPKGFERSKWDVRQQAAEREAAWQARQEELRERREHQRRQEEAQAALMRQSSAGGEGEHEEGSVAGPAAPV